MDGMIELLVILAIFVLLPALEAWGKRRRKGGGAGSPPGESRQGGEVSGGRAGRTERTAGRGSGPRRGSEQESAGVLLPEDLWEELTGGRRRDAEEPAATAERDGIGSSGPDAAPPFESRPSATEEAAERPLETAPEPSETWSGEGWRPETRRGAAGAEDRYRTEIPPPSDGPADGLGREVGGFPGPEEPRPADPVDEARARREAAGLRRAAAPGRATGRRRGARGEPHPLLGELDRDSLRRAVLYREILGPPVALRDE